MRISHVIFFVFILALLSTCSKEEFQFDQTKLISLEDDVHASIAYAYNDEGFLIKEKNDKKVYGLPYEESFFYNSDKKLSKIELDVSNFGRVWKYDRVYAYGQDGKILNVIETPVDPVSNVITLTKPVYNNSGKIIEDSLFLLQNTIVKLQFVNKYSYNNNNLIKIDAWQFVDNTTASNYRTIHYSYNSNKNFFKGMYPAYHPFSKDYATTIFTLFPVIYESNENNVSGIIISTPSSNLEFSVYYKSFNKHGLPLEFEMSSSQTLQKFICRYE